MRIPTDAEYRQFRGNHCFNIWARLSDHWRCPVCNRTKRENMRWTKIQWQWDTGKNLGKGNKVWGWASGFAHHHDHGSDFDYIQGKRINERFKEILICDLCNWADGQAKRKLLIHDRFSFAPDEIKQFIEPKPHTKSHKIDLEKAWEVYLKAENEAWKNKF